MVKRKIVLAGGGTGGHLYPGLALAEKLNEFSAEKIDMLFVGSADGLESKIIPEFNYTLETLPVGRGSPVSLRHPCNFPRFIHGLLKCMELFKEIKPAAVVSLGGYAAFVPGLIAGLFKIPLYLLEQNSMPGRVNKQLARFACNIFLQFKEAENHLGKYSQKACYIGSPLLSVMEGFSSYSLCEERNKFLVLGGSQGSFNLNSIICEIYPVLSKAGIEIIHVAGDKDFTRVNNKAHMYENIEVISYSADLSEIYRKTRLAIARAGASTINEFQAAGIPAVFVPFPEAKDNHQLLNAEAVLGVSSKYIQIESEIDLNEFSEQIISLWNNNNELNIMSNNMQSGFKANAASGIAETIVKQLGL
ncbi:MAG: UDP-N-acetylglucosamine--N-acetylmuramyl-(pentapeptide) pyrophosphoryl-undecaprenol N-acetylglucosamine transferase [Planctomycetota bacterium]